MVTVLLIIAASGFQARSAAFPAGTSCKAWRLVPFPPVSSGLVSGVSGTSAADVWAVGQVIGLPYEPIIRHWDGHKWKRVPQEHIGDGELHAVAATSTTDVWAVGKYGRALAMHWDGTEWKVVPTPSPGQYEDLTAIAALSSTDVWAVGGYTEIQQGHGLILRWNGTQWTLQPDAPNPNGVFLNGVAAVTPDDVWAVGYETPGLGVYSPIIEHWDGSQWSLVETPPPPMGSNNVLYGVAAVSSTDVWAVGHYGTSGTDIHPLVERWDGASWNLVDTPQMSASLEGISGSATSDVWAVGFSISYSGTAAMSMHWDGQLWSTMRTPSPGSNGALFSVDVMSESDIWAVGGYFNADSGSTEPLSEFSKGACP